MESSGIEARLRALEDREAIRALKARYFACCDGKDPAGMQACFVDGPVRIDYGKVGVFERASQLAEVFRKMGCHEHIVEMHQGADPQIDITGPDSARGRWDLHYQQINTKDRTLTQLGAYYEDEYRRTADGWRMSTTRCVVTSTLVLHLGEAEVKTLFAGRAA